MPGYPLPDDFSDLETLCIKVYVPSHALFIGEFWRAYSFFGKWVAWHKDGSGRAKQAAELWKVLIDQARAEFDAGYGCGVMDVRQNPDLPCKLEKTFDGVEWIQFADLLKCLDLRNQLVPGTYPEPPETRTPQEAAADDLIAWILQLLEDLFDAIETGGTDAEVKELYDQKVRKLSPGNPVEKVADKLLLDLRARTVQELKDAKDNADWQGVYDVAACSASSDGSWLNEAADAIFEWLNDSSDWLFNALSKTVELLGGAGLTRSAYETVGQGASGFPEPDCFEWTLLSTIELPANTGAVQSFGVLSSLGQTYKIKVRGTMNYWGASDGQCDAGWFYLRDPITENSPLHFSTGPAALFDPGAYDLLHEYEIVYNGDNSIWRMYVGDSNYGDNSGSFTAELYKLTGEL